MSLIRTFVIFYVVLSCERKLYKTFTKSFNWEKNVCGKPSEVMIPLSPPGLSALYHFISLASHLTLIFFCYTSENMELGRLSVHIYLEYVIGWREEDHTCAFLFADYCLYINAKYTHWFHKCREYILVSRAVGESMQVVRFHPLFWIFHEKDLVLLLSFHLSRSHWFLTYSSKKIQIVTIEHR